MASSSLKRSSCAHTVKMLKEREKKDIKITKEKNRSAQNVFQIIHPFVYSDKKKKKITILFLLLAYYW